MSLPPKNVTKGVSGFVQLLQQRGFIDLVSSTIAGRERFVADYGPLGSLLRQNILKQWWDLMVATQTNVFPVQSPLLRNLEFDDMFEGKILIKYICTKITYICSNFLRYPDKLNYDCSAKYPQVLKLTNGKLPFSITSFGLCLSKKTCDQREEMIEKNLLLGSSLETKLTLQNYISPANASAVHDFWLQTRLTWWKKFSRNPECFSVASMASAESSGSEEISEDKQNGNGSAENSMAILYNFPWGQEPVESINNLRDSLHKKLPQREMEACLIKSLGKKAFLPACIECTTSVEAAMAAWLVDAYRERHPLSARKKSARSKAQQVLQLHPQLTPYQVALVLANPTLQSFTSASSSSMGIELRYICDSLEKDLKKAGISVFNASHHGGSLDAHLRRNDQLGVVYTVIIDQNTVTDGLVNTRSRDTQVKVTSHISSLVKEFSRNLNAQLSRW